MIPQPNLLLIGATGRNVGKTEYACRLVRRLAAAGPVAAAKITVVREGGASCPQGGEGCGACGSLAGRPFLLQSEECPGTVKDTQRLRAHGAVPVWWLRVRHDALDAGLAALAASLDPQVPVVAESNTARLGLDPGLFLVVADDDGPMKASCRAVLPWADAVIQRRGDTWDWPPERLAWADGRWRFDVDVGVVVLAGGRSRRMGRDKALLPFAGQPLIAHIIAQVRILGDSILIGANDSGRFAFLGCPVIADQRPDEGPLMGLMSCLAASRHELNVVLSCDVPTIDVHLLRRMIVAAEGADAVVAVDAAGRPEPLFAVYRRSCAPVAEAILAAGGRRLTDLLERITVRRVPLPEGDWYRNLNTPDDYRAALAAAGLS
jgi:molybdopterin-guanine dinucleotide biosynthesis protein A